MTRTNRCAALAWTVTFSWFVLAGCAGESQIVPLYCGGAPPMPAPQMPAFTVQAPPASFAAPPASFAPPPASFPAPLSAPAPALAQMPAAPLPLLAAPLPAITPAPAPIAPAAPAAPASEVLLHHAELHGKIERHDGNRLTIEPLVSTSSNLPAAGIKGDLYVASAEAGDEWLLVAEVEVATAARFGAVMDVDILDEGAEMTEEDELGKFLKPGSRVRLQWMF